MEVIHIKDVCKKVGLCRTMIFEMCRDASSDFPRPISLSPSGKRKGFIKSEIENWLEKRVAERDRAA
ncbi:helix-turn-helix transcriptional regulator [Arvimicrobium flavum]|uniref:helix-turn-helix transcriptional regulator n=1 Tax=Arvimicrobium flavum TaxID=3393320 RepID=UPI00237A5CFF|nr:AlpA family phage regulatory protein [Mesorhizobium shangrilense]